MGDYSNDYSKWDNIEVSSDEEMEDTNFRDVPNEAPFEQNFALPSAVQTIAKKNVGKSQYGSLDYSKWDNLEDSSDEEEMKPKVKKLDKPSSITIGPGGYQINAPKPATKSKKIVQMPSAWSLNGNKLGEYVWSQTRDFLEVRFFVPKETRASEVRIQLNSKSCKVYIKNEIFIEGLFLFDIHDTKDEMDKQDKFESHVENSTDFDQLDIDWEIIEHPSVQGRVLVLVGLQKNPPKGLYNWWDKFFKRDEAIDVQHLKGRRDPKDQEVWRTAHEMFKNKVKNQGKIPIPVFDKDATEDSKEEEILEILKKRHNC